MNKIKIIIFVLVAMFLSNNSFAATKQDCSQYSTKTLTGLMDRMKCNKGEPVAERKKPKKFSDLNPLKPKKSKKKEPKVITSCDDHSTKNFVGLFRKIRCKFD